MKKAIFITVRTGSTRLPNKCLLKIENKPTIEYLIQNLKRSKQTDLIVLCTTTRDRDNILCTIATNNGIEFFRGSEEDKLERWNGAAKKYNIDFFVTADGDDLFCEPELIDLAFSQYTKSNCDFIEEKPGKNMPVGAFTYGIKVSALKKVCQIKDTSETEMMSVYFTNTNLFTVEELHPIPEILKRPEIRITLDYEDDLKFFQNIIIHFTKIQKNYNLRDIIEYLDKNPEVIKINQHLQEAFLSNQKKKTKLILKDA